MNESRNEPRDTRAKMQTENLFHSLKTQSSPKKMIVNKN